MTSISHRQSWLVQMEGAGATFPPHRSRCCLSVHVSLHRQRRHPRCQRDQRDSNQQRPCCQRHPRLQYRPRRGHSVQLLRFVFVKTCAAGGEQSFRAKVIAIRAQFPPVKVKFISTLAGDTDKLALPVPLEAFVMADKITTTEPAMPTLARLRGKRAGPHS